MTKILLLLFSIANSLLIAEDEPMVCAGKVPWLNEKYKNEPRHFYMVSSAQGNIIVGDAQTIDIDKKNKIVKLWTTEFYSYKSQAEEVKKYGQKYSDLGYVKDFVVFDLINKKTKILHVSSYMCDGNVIHSSSVASDWHYIVPNSVGEAQFENLKQKYGL